jgi:hypothetical protein
MFKLYKLHYATNIVVEEIKSSGYQPFSEILSCINEHQSIGKDLLKAGHGKYFAAAHQITVTTIAYEKLVNQLYTKSGWDVMAADLCKAVEVAFKLVAKEEPEAIASIAMGETDPKVLARRWREKAEPEGQKLWERFQITFAAVIETDKNNVPPWSR